MIFGSVPSPTIGPKTGARKANVVLAAAERNFRERTKVSMKASGDYDVLFTDGSTPRPTAR